MRMREVREVMEMRVREVMGMMGMMEMRVREVMGMMEVREVRGMMEMRKVRGMGNSEFRIPNSELVKNVAWVEVRNPRAMGLGR